ncbi:MAG: hypothetical protein ACLFNW_08380, partial [Desulfobacterales bacterium]
EFAGRRVASRADARPECSGRKARPRVDQHPKNQTVGFCFSRPYNNPGPLTRPCKNQIASCTLCRLGPAISCFSINDLLDTNTGVDILILSKACFQTPAVEKPGIRTGLTLNHSSTEKSQYDRRKHVHQY